MNLELLSHRNELAIKVVLDGLGELESYDISLNLIYMFSQSVVRFYNDESVVNRLTSKASFVENLIFLDKRVSSVGITLVPLEGNLLLPVRPLFVLSCFNESVDSIRDTVCRKSNTG